ncbi:MAG: response regulator [Phycisphaerales bacterium]
MRVLVAEDDRITRMSLVRQLEAWGHTVTSVEDGAAAWALLEKGGSGFDLVLTDWEMPNLSGPELIGRLRSLSGTPYVYTVLLTSRSGKGDVASGIEQGADDYVAKPFDKGELRARLLAGERVVRLERTLAEQNAALREADERLRRDLQAAARVQRAMLPRGVIETQRVKTAWRYVPTEELAGDALGLDLIDDRYLVSYVLDVSGHGVSAALLAVTAMHGLAPSSRGMEALRHGLEHPRPEPLTASVVTELNRRLARSDNDGRFLTIVLSVLDTQTGRLRFTRARIRCRCWFAADRSSR